MINCDDVGVPANQADTDSPFAAFGHLPSMVRDYLTVYKRMMEG